MILDVTMAEQHSLMVYAIQSLHELVADTFAAKTFSLHVERVPPCPGLRTGFQLLKQ